MRSVVVFESMYGNTHTIAERIAAELAVHGPVKLASTADVTMHDVLSADLVVCGAPTHVHGLSTHSSRRAAAADASADAAVDLDPDARNLGMRDWLKQLPDGTGRRAAAFDTRLDRSALLTGSAARGIAKRLQRKGFSPVDVESFLVDEGVGPLVDGEAQRAAEWAASLASATLGAPA